MPSKTCIHKHESKYRHKGTEHKFRNKKYDKSRYQHKIVKKSPAPKTLSAGHKNQWAIQDLNL